MAGSRRGATTPAEAIGIASDPYQRVNGRVDVVLVDDDPAVAALIVHALESHQYTVRWLRHGREAPRRSSSARSGSISRRTGSAT